VIKEKLIQFKMNCDYNHHHNYLLESTEVSSLAFLEPVNNKAQYEEHKEYELNKLWPNKRMNKEKGVSQSNL